MIQTMKKKIEIHVLYAPTTLWGYPRTVITHCADGTTLEEAETMAASLSKEQGQPYNRKYKVERVTVCVSYA